MDRRPRILIVDDHPANIAILEEMLCDDYRVVSVLSGTEALAALEDFRPDLILLDIMMPGIDGYEVCRRIRADSEHRHTKILMLSAKALLEERLAGYQAGADDYVTKPFDEDELLSKIRVFLRLKTEEEVEQLKDELLMVLQDEDRTPFQSLIVPAEALADGAEMPDDRRRRYGALICHNAGLVREFFEQVLELCALRSGESRLDLCEVDANAVVHAAARTAAERGHRPDVDIEVEGKLTRTLVADGPRLERAFAELVQSGVQSSAARRVLTVEIVENDGGVEVRIRRRGEPIPADLLPHLLAIPRNRDPDEWRTGFTDDATVVETPRARLGLALASETIRALGGSISVRNEDDGSSFLVRLPFATELAPAS